MAYPATFHRLVIMGNIYGDVFNTTLAFSNSAETGGMPAATQPLADALKAAVSGWWNDALSSTSGGGISLISSAQFTGLKVNRIGTDGRYLDAGTIESLATTPVPGAVNLFPPAQSTLAATLLGAEPRARAGRGRMYFPPSSLVSEVGSDGRITAAQAAQYAQGVATLLRILSITYDTAGVDGLPSISSKVGTGAFQLITNVSAGRVVDTIRSRRSKLVEDYQEVPL